MTSRRVITVSGDADREAEVAGWLTSRPDVDVILRCVDRIEVLAAVEGGSLDAAVVVGPARWLDRDTVEIARAAGVRVLGLPIAGDDALLLGDIGCEVLPTAASTEMIVERLRSPAAPSPTASASTRHRPFGKEIVVWGPKGAPGRTRIAIELAYLAGSSGSSSALIDADPFGGDIGQLLGLAPDLPALPFLSRHLSELESLFGMVDWGTVIPGVIDPSHGRDVSREGWSRLRDELRARHDLTFSDIGFFVEDATESPGQIVRGRDGIARDALQTADVVVAVFRGDPVGMKHLLWGWNHLRNRIDPGKVVLVANQVASGCERPLGDALRRHVGRGSDALVPLRIERVAEAVRRGKPLSEIARSSDIPRSLERVVERLGVAVPPRGVLARLGGRG